MTSKQRAYLKSLAADMEAVFQVGKASVTPEFISALDDVLEKRELIKVSVLQNCADDPRELAGMIAERTRSEVVHVIGKKMVFYRQAKDPKKRRIELPPAGKKAQ